VNRLPFPLRFVLLLGLAVSLTGCFTSGTFLSGHVTNVQLAEANYTIVATNVQGTATAGYLFGVSGSRFGLSTNALALVPISGEPQLYQAALADLWRNIESEYGTVEGERLALVNVRYDVDALNLLVYTQPTLTVRADVIEFTE